MKATGKGKDSALTQMAQALLGIQLPMSKLRCVSSYIRK